MACFHNNGLVVTSLSIDSASSSTTSGSLTSFKGPIVDHNKLDQDKEVKDFLVNNNGDGNQTGKNSIQSKGKICLKIINNMSYLIKQNSYGLLDKMIDTMII